MADPRQCVATCPISSSWCGTKRSIPARCSTWPCLSIRWRRVTARWTSAARSRRCYAQPNDRHSRAPRQLRSAVRDQGMNIRRKQCLMWSSSCGPANPNSRRSVSLKHSLKTLWIEELPDPGVLAVSNFIFGSDREESTFVKHRDTVGDTEGTWQVMGYDDHCHLEGPLEKQNQLIQFRRNYRIETGGRF